MFGINNQWFAVCDWCFDGLNRRTPSRCAIFMSQILFCRSSIWYARINDVVLGFPKMELKRVNEEKASSTLRTTFHSNFYFLFTSNITTLNREESTAQCINTWRMSRNVVKKLIWTKHRRSKRQGESNFFRFFSLSLFNFFYRSVAYSSISGSLVKY